ncbi:MAG: FAD-dependent oxidoreductase [Brooklawnia sp.]|uniref:oxidoreductase n=1 Tax=Brooklawnia sp. TaxID=2699740 RepID=UPI003C708D8E
MRAYEHLFSPISIGTLQLRNRGIMAPMVVGLCGQDGQVTDDFVAYHVARARGGVGMNITGGAFVDPRSKVSPRQLGCHNDDMIPGLRRLADAVHQAGGRVAVQLLHAGRQSNPLFSQTPLVAPSPIACGVLQVVPHELTTAEIHDLVNAFAAAARRCQQAGIDAIEVHGAHGYLINQFLSPHTNNRTDEYGGDAERRARFPLEVVDAVRAEVGLDYPVMYRISANEYLPDGLTPDDTAAFCRELVEHGIDAIHVSGGTYESNVAAGTEALPLGAFVDDAMAIREGIGRAVPVAVANRIKTPEFADQLIADDKVDIVATGRPLICDPDFYIKAQRGDAADIRVCLSCNWCINQTGMGVHATCLYNPEMGNELRYAHVPAPTHELDVVVVGGGLAGMEAAHTAAGRGHRVRLYEQTDELGGNILPGVRPPFKSEMFACVDYETHMVAKTGVQVEFGQLVDADFLAQLGADALIIATGSAPLVPPIPGADEEVVVVAEDVLLGTVDVGGRVVVIGGGSVGVETAELLATQGREVTVVEMTDKILADMNPGMAYPLMARVAALPIRIVTGERVVEITPEAVVTDAQRIDCDTAVLAVGYAADVELSQELTARGVPHVLIGDAVKPRKIRDAVVEGHDAGLAVGVPATGVSA